MQSGLIECRWGVKCGDFTENHRKMFGHGSSEKMVCKYNPCKLANDEMHLMKYVHQISLPECKFGSSCNNTNQQHLNKFTHKSAVSVKKIDCRYGATCNNSSPDHLKKFEHPCKEAPVEKTCPQPETSVKKACKYNPCNMMDNVDHITKFSHMDQLLKK